MLSIGGTVARVSARDLSILPSPDPHHYSEFVSDAAASELPAPDLDIEVVAGPPSATAGEIVFDSGSPWLMRTDGEGYRLEFRMLGATEPHTVVTD